MDNPLLIGLTCGGAFLLAFLLVNHPGRSNTVANRWLAFFVWTFACAMLEIFLHNLSLHVQYPTAFAFVEAVRFLSAPTLYLSILFFTTPSKRFKLQDLWHFAPFAFWILYQVVNVWRGENLRFDSELAQSAFLHIIRIVIPLQAVAYLFISFIRLRQHQRNIEKVASATKAVDLSWLRHFLLALVAVVLVWFNLAFFNITELFSYTPFLYLAGLYSLAYFSLRQKEVFSFAPAQLAELEPIIGSAGSDKNEKQKRLSESMVQSLQVKLEQVMQYDKAFLENELSLPVLAHKVGVSAHELSYLINEVYGENFYAFVNRHRVEEAKRLLSSTQHDQLNMLGVAFQAGFNSKTTFNTAFKKLTRQSPTEFVKQSLQQQQAKNA
ncbi:AraC family transcriptional regulator [Pontibacter diazotrophicus]|uniref:AraC family transcriptional regulator n=1 Tax=Pontibacter diazotrophicus TaxID=1400979 RepID=A0A3D8L5D5_9BACT|nr:helix-turn-helix domain-containing protein [Pontibacter diazotrophicus]RDV12624.1 AraC family transcriptional regulator [Pontibacter diazotrophicus]